MYNGILARRKIASLQKRKKNRIVILPYGEYGRWFETRMNYYGMKPVYCIDNHVFDDTHVFKADNCYYMDRSITYLLTTEKKEIYWKMRADLVARGVKEDQIESAQDGFDDIHRIMTSSDKIQLDFLCVGVAKCGTTSLDAALKVNPKIFTPSIKETYFCHFMTDATYNIFFQSYFQASKMKNTKYSLLGGVEPSYTPDAEMVYRYFGNNIKLIILLRNPVERFLSEIKDQTRHPFPGERIISCYRKHNGFSPEFIDEYIHNMATCRLYSEVFKYWLTYFSLDQILIILSEEMFSNPCGTMDRIQKFIGIKDSERIRYDTFPRENQNLNGVAENYNAIRINQLMYETTLYASDLEFRKKLDTLHHRVLNYTTCNRNIPESARSYLIEIFSEDIAKTEEIIGRSLPYFKD